MLIKIIDRYFGVLNTPAVCTPDTPTEDSHLVWMLKEILFNPLQSTTKKHRWLGYVQGVMVMKGYLTVQEERDNTREILNGD